jgi:hypothetical protein
MVHKNLLAAILLPCGFQPVAFGQSLNIDLGMPGSSAPSSHYGAAAGQAGFWNNVSGQFTVPLRDLNDQATSAIAVSYTNGQSTTTIPDASLDDNTLMSDYVLGAQNSGVVSLLGLSAGTYKIYLYAWDGLPGHDPANNHIELRGIYGNTQAQHQFLTSTTFDGVWPGSHVQGETFATASFTLSEGDFFQIDLIPQGSGEDPYVGILQGFQLVMVPAPASAALLMGGALSAARRRRGR